MMGMKSTMIMILAMVFIAVGINTASAAVNVHVNTTTPYDTLYQGQIVSASVTVKNNENYPVRIYSVGVHYDWMPENEFSQVDFGKGYVQVEPNGSTVPGQLVMRCDNNVSAGYHSLYYKVDLNRYSSYNATWLNETVIQPGSIYVESPVKPEALQELQFANKTLSDVLATNFTSKKGKENLQNAMSAMDDGWSAYNTNDYYRAINDSHAAIDYVSNAKCAEKNYRDNAIDIEKIVVSVNDKLRSVNSTDDPDTRDSLNESLGYLNRTKQYIDSEDFVSALTYVNQADHAADKAIDQQFYYFLKKNESEAARSSALSALDNAQKSLDGAANMTGASSKVILNDARNKMADANVMFSQSDYANATIKAKVVSALVTQANSDEASYRMMLAHDRIESSGDLKSQDAIALLANASLEYNQSESDYTAGRYIDAISHADSAMKLSDDSASAEQKWHSDHPTNAVSPGFGALTALIVFVAIFIWRERKS